MAILTRMFDRFREFLSAIYRDLIGIIILIKVETKMYLMDKKSLLVADLFRKLVRMQPNKPCIIFNDQVWTFQQVIYKYINFFLIYF